MPIYEYICEDCKQKFVILIRNSEEENGAVCSNCGSRKLRKIFSSFATGDPEESGSTAGPCSCGGPC